jgi:hypothetical protein
MILDLINMDHYCKRDLNNHVNNIFLSQGVLYMDHNLGNLDFLSNIIMIQG